MSNTLIAYGTRYGATAEVSEKIAEILRTEFRLKVDVINVEDKSIKSILLNDYENIVIGSGIKIGAWVSKAKKFLKNNFHEKKLAIFVCSRRAGESDLYDYAYTTYIEKIISNYLKTKPIASEAFGGRKPLKDGSFYENRDWTKITNWAKELGQIFSN